MLSPVLCSDCEQVLKRVQELENGIQPIVDYSAAENDPEPSKHFKHCEHEEQFREYNLYKRYLGKDDSFNHKSTRETPVK